MRSGRRLTTLLPVAALLLLGALVAASVSGSAASTVRSSSAVADLGPAPRTETGFKNLDPKFHRASNWVRVRLFLLGMFSVFNRDTHFDPLPLGAPDLVWLRQNRTEATATWIGHATVLLQVDGVNILTDPNWSDRVGPFNGLVGVGRYRRDRTLPLTGIGVEHRTCRPAEDHTQSVEVVRVRVADLNSIAVHEHLFPAGEPGD